MKNDNTPAKMSKGGALRRSRCCSGISTCGLQGSMIKPGFFVALEGPLYHLSYRATPMQTPWNSG